MKKNKLLFPALFIALATITVSCTVSRPYRDYPPAPGPSLSLIVDPFPGIVVNRYADGRYYYRSPQGYTYWHGYNNRYYIDRSYVGRGYYSHRQYNDWKRGGNYSGRRHRH